MKFILKTSASLLLLSLVLRLLPGGALAASTTAPVSSHSLTEDQAVELTVTLNGTDITKDLYSDSDTHVSFLEYTPSTASISLQSIDSACWDDSWTCFKDQLSGDVLALYQAFETAFAQDTVINTGTAWRVNDALTKNVPFSGDSKDELKQCTSSIRSAVTTASKAFVMDHPEYFWIRSSCTASCSSTTQGNTLIVSVSVGFVAYSTSDTEEKVAALQTQIDHVMDDILTATQDLNLYDQLAYMDNWLAEHNHYNLTAATSTAYLAYDETPWSIVGALLEDYAPVCEGYSKAFQLFCHEIGVPCLQIIGLGVANGEEQHHMWTYVRLNNVWYLCDPTWDDPLYVGGGDVSESTRAYFMVPAQDDHIPDMTMLIPQPTTEEYVLANHTFTPWTQTKAPTCTEKGEKTHLCSQCGYTESCKIPAVGHSFSTYQDTDGLKISHCDYNCGFEDIQIGTPSWHVENNTVTGTEYTSGFVAIALYSANGRLISMKFCLPCEYTVIDGRIVCQYLPPEFSTAELSRASTILCYNFSEDYTPLRAALPL